jgi:hypothetical protein
MAPPLDPPDELPPELPLDPDELPLALPLDPPDELPLELLDPPDEPPLEVPPPSAAFEGTGSEELAHPTDKRTTQGIVSQKPAVGVKPGDLFEESMSSAH